MRAAFQLTILLLVTLGLACTTMDANDIPKDKEKEDPKTVTTKSGLKYLDTKEGTGDNAQAGDVVEVHYTGWTTKDGKKFDSSVDRAETYKFKLGVSQVIKGWHEGIAGMRVGGKRTLFIPPDLAYGDAGRAPAIPPNAELKFDVELIKIK